MVVMFCIYYTGRKKNSVIKTQTKDWSFSIQFVPPNPSGLQGTESRRACPVTSRSSFKSNRTWWRGQVQSDSYLTMHVGFLGRVWLQLSSLVVVVLMNLKQAHALYVTINQNLSIAHYWIKATAHKHNKHFSSSSKKGRSQWIMRLNNEVRGGSGHLSKLKCLCEQVNQKPNVQTVFIPRVITGSTQLIKKNKKLWK